MVERDLGKSAWLVGRSLDRGKCPTVRYRGTVSRSVPSVSVPSVAQARTRAVGEESKRSTNQSRRDAIEDGRRREENWETAKTLLEG